MREQPPPPSHERSSPVQQSFTNRRFSRLDEVDLISTARLGFALLPSEVQQKSPALLGKYPDLRGRFFRPPLDEATVATRKETQARLEGALWDEVLRRLQSPAATPHAAILLIPALNAMFDVATARLLATENHPRRSSPRSLSA